MHSIVTDPAALRATMLRTLDARTTHRGEISFPCIPAPLDHYIERLRGFFASLGKSLSAAELGELRTLLAKSLHEGFDNSGNAQLVVSYETTATPQLLKNLACSLALKYPSDSGKYQDWRPSTNERSLFGSHPDARVLALIQASGEPRSVPVLDVGAGNGRNAIPLARRGHPIDALERTPRFVEHLRSVAETERLPLRVLAGDFFDPTTPLPNAHYQVIVLAEVVSDFRGTDQLRSLLVRASEALRGGGALIFNIFLAELSYQPDDLARQMSEVAWACLFTRDDLRQALGDLPLSLESNESVVEYEKAHLPPHTWPPTPWFESWASGQSIFPVPQGRPPVEMRWLVLRRK